MGCQCEDSTDSMHALDEQIRECERATIRLKYTQNSLLNRNSEISCVGTSSPRATPVSEHHMYHGGCPMYPPAALALKWFGGMASSLETTKVLSPSH